MGFLFCGRIEVTKIVTLLHRNVPTQFAVNQRLQMTHGYVLFTDNPDIFLMFFS